MAKISEGQLKVVEKLIGDQEFRTGFFEDPESAVAKVGIELTEEELAGLKGLDYDILSSTLTDLDARLSKATATVAVGATQDMASAITNVVAQFFGATTSV